MIKVRIVLVGVEGEENIGYAARTMSNFNFSDLVLVSPKAGITGITMQRAMRAAAMLENVKIFNNIESATRGSKVIVGTTGKVATEKNLLRSAITPKQFAKNLAARGGTVSILFGRESSGLTNKELEKCDLIVTIPTDPANPALNISNAIAIVLYEIFATSARGKILSSSKERKILYGFFDELVRISAAQETRKKTAKRVFRNVINRSLMSRNELSTITGALRKNRDKLKKK
ncbi:MAG: TrmJ/YjtD family RNA methyltransferase [Candidatus Aenigmarchaeota archaeon]|nr:TrmJ/YjtD family RNA methyltransferase [Candidatus Aenigmarchaeota archaeon]